MARKQKDAAVEEKNVSIEAAVKAVEPAPVKSKDDKIPAVEPKKSAPKTAAPAPKKTAAPKKAEKAADPKPAKKSLKTGLHKMFAARVYASSVAKTPITLAIGQCFIIDTEEHDGRIRVSVDELGTKCGWADIDELMR